MHYYILLTCRVEEAVDALFWIDNLLGVICDVTIILSVSLLITWRRQKICLLIMAIITLFWSFSNILYSRFFHHYISLSAVGQVGNLADSFMLQNMAEGLQWTDFSFLIILMQILWLYYNSPQNAIIVKPSLLLLKWPIGLLIIDTIFHFLFCITTPELRSLSYLRHRLYVRHCEFLHGSAEPNWASFHR